MLGIEHEGFANNPAWYTEAQYQASAQLTSPVWQELVVVTATSDMASFEVYPGSEAGQRFYRLLLD
jgi:N-acetyl-anhydromuramyl-L-alanine amidase AmpD